jgi:hypothetical protein
LVLSSMPRLTRSFCTSRMSWKAGNVWRDRSHPGLNVSVFFSK